LSIEIALLHAEPGRHAHQRRSQKSAQQGREYDGDQMAAEGAHYSHAKRLVPSEYDSVNSCRPVFMRVGNIGSTVQPSPYAASRCAACG
jgi:hypothetical protein